MVPSYVHPDDSYTLKNLIGDSGDYGLKFDEEGYVCDILVVNRNERLKFDEEGNVCDSEGRIFVDENDNSWSKDCD